VVLGLSMVLLIVGLIATAMDLAELYAARVRFDDAAEQAALAGASQVAVCPPASQGCAEPAVGGAPPQLEPSYRWVCQSAGDAVSEIPQSTSCAVVAGTVNTVEATVSAPVAVPIPLPGMGGSFTVSATYTAAPVLGAQSPAA